MPFELHTIPTRSWTCTRSLDLLNGPTTASHSRSCRPSPPPYQARSHPHHNPPPPPPPKLLPPPNEVENPPLPDCSCCARMPGSRSWNSRDASQLKVPVSRASATCLCRAGWDGGRG